MTIAVAPDRALLQTMAERLHEARARTLPPGGAAQRRGAARPARSADEPDPLGPGAHRALRGAVAHPQPRRPDRVRRDARDVQPLRAPAERRAGRWPCRASTNVEGSWTRSGAGCSARIAATDLDDANPLLRDGYVYRMVLQHEYQHNETILQTLQLKLRRAVLAARSRLRPPSGARRAAPAPGDMVRFPGGPVEIGTDDRSAAYDNERPRHVVEVPPFLIDVNPVTNGDFLDFIAAGGYATPEYWSEGGRRWLAESGAQAPKYWFLGEGRWMTRVMDRAGAVDPRHPVCHVSWYEAEAFARFAGKRLPTEIEWEAAASWDPATGRKRRFPWGDEPASRDAGQPRSARLRHRSGGRVPAQRLADRLLRDDRRRVGMDRERLPPVARVRGVPVPGVFRSLLRYRVQGPPRGLVGHPARCGSQHVPQLGLPYPPPDLQRLQVRP